MWDKRQLGQQGVGDRVVTGAGAMHPGFWGRCSPGDWVSGQVKAKDAWAHVSRVPELWLSRSLTAAHLCRCWFGKEPGDLVDYIYQGPIILVLLVGGHWDGTGRWALGAHPAERLQREPRGLESPAARTRSVHVALLPDTSLPNSLSPRSLPMQPLPSLALLGGEWA